MAQRVVSVAVLLALFFLPLYPKIALLAVPGTYVPVRFDDLIVAVVALVWLVWVLVRKRRPDAPTAIAGAAVLWLTVALVALVYGAFMLRTIGAITGLAFWAKPVEYVLLGLITYDVMRSGALSVRAFIATVVGSACIVVAYGVAEHLLLVPHLPGQVPTIGGVTSTIGDVHELASYLGIVVILVVCVFDQVGSRALRVGLAVVIGASALVEFSTAARSEFVALFVVLVLLLVWRPARMPAALGASLMALLFVSPLVPNLLPTGQTQGGAGQHGTTQGAQAGPQATQAPADLASNTVTNRFLNYSLVQSLSDRFTKKWPAMVANTMRSPLIGLGPSAATEAADGYYMRSFVESGIIGLATFVLLLGAIAVSSFRAARGSNGVARAMSVCAIGMTLFVALVSVLIDTWVASRVMELYWPILAATLGVVAFQTSRSESSIDVVGRQPVAAASNA